jgi:sodium/bile acid cotransporter 7
MIIFLLALLFFAMYGSITLVCRLMKFNREDTITATFCGSKKSMMHGTVMSKVLFRGYPSVGEILLPLMLYHALQLMIVSIIAMKKAKESDCKK